MSFFGKKKNKENQENTEKKEIKEKKSYKSSKAFIILKALKNLKEFESVKNLKIVKAKDSLSKKNEGLKDIVPRAFVRSIPHILIMVLIISIINPMDIAERIGGNGNTAQPAGVSGNTAMVDAAAENAVSGNEASDVSANEVNAAAEQTADEEEVIAGTNGMTVRVRGIGLRSVGASNLDNIEWNAADDVSEYDANIISNRNELVKRIWSIMSSFKTIQGSGKNKGKAVGYYGLRGEQICALLGNWEQESALDPTAVEAVFYEPWRIGATKREAVRCNFITEYYWGTNEINGYFERHDNIYKAGIGLAQWTDTYSGTQSLDAGNAVGADVYTDGYESGAADDSGNSILDDDNGGSLLDDDSEIGSGNDEIRLDDSSEIASDSSYEAEEAEYAPNVRTTRTVNSRRSAGRNSRLTSYADKRGQQLYNGLNKDAELWNSDDWIESAGSVKGTWCDPLVQLAYTLDTKNGDSRAAWINSWAEQGETVWKGDRGVDLGELSDNVLEGWTWDDSNAFTTEHGWDPSLFYVADDVVEFSSIADMVSPSGENTEDRTDFRAYDSSLRSGAGNDSYYNTPNNDYIASIRYDSWDWENGKALSTSGVQWNMASRTEPQAGGPNAARNQAFEYAEKSAGLAWHGRIDNLAGDLGPSPGWNDYSRAAGHDFICENNAANIFISENGIEQDGPFQHYGVVEDDLSYDSDGNEVHNYKYGWIMDADPTAVANDRAKDQYRNLFKYIYRYHLYRYMTMYYTAQFLAEYEGVPGKALEERERNALKWFQLWWDTGLEGKAEPNIYAKGGIFEVNPDFARIITESFEQSKDAP